MRTGAARRWARGATEVCMQGGIHPAYTGATYLDDLPRGEGSGAGDARARLLAARSAGRAPRRSAPAPRFPVPLEATPGSARCPAPPPKSSTTRCGPSSVPTRSVPRMARGDAHRASRWASARPRRSCSAMSTATSIGRGICCAFARCRRKPAASPSSCRCRSCTWKRRST